MLYRGFAAKASPGNRHSENDVLHLQQAGQDIRTVLDPPTSASLRHAAIATYIYCCEFWPQAIARQRLRSVPLLETTAALNNTEPNPLPQPNAITAPS
jgi:hypothetical protein